jgi:hypothetical protein
MIGVVMAMLRFRRIAVSILFAILVIFQAVLAEGGKLEFGQRVRVEVDTTITKRVFLLFKESKSTTVRRTGILTACSNDTLTLYIEIGIDTSTYCVSRADVKKIFVSIGKKRATIRGILHGTTIGTILFSALLLGDCEKGVDCKSRENVLKAAAFLVGGGGILGGMIGWNVKVDRWSEIDPEIRCRDKYGISNDYTAYLRLNLNLR